MTLSGALTLRAGDMIHSMQYKNADGTPMRARVTSVKTWKTRPDAIEIHYKRGLYEYGVFAARDLPLIGIGNGL